MGYRAHVQTKHEIEYGSEEFFGWCNDALYEWLWDYAEVDIHTNDEWGCGDEWEIRKDSLHQIPESAYSSESVAGLVGKTKCTEEDVVEELHAFIDALIAAPTGEWVYVSWF